MIASTCLQCGADLIPDSSPAGLCPACLLTTALSIDRDVGDSDVDALEDSPYALGCGATVGPFQIIGPLGKGGMATVYEAYDPRLERAVALKVLPADFLHDDAFTNRFEKEARVIAKLEHPNIVPIYASGIDDGVAWMSMRLLSGGNLSGLVENGRTDPVDLVRMLRDIAGALDYAHARGVVHRDIKPTNLLLDGAGRVCVADFGLAQMLERRPGLTRTGMLAGTPHYMAPEQALGNPVDHRCDIYSLGIVGYEMLVGEVPFTADSPIAVLLKHVNESLPAPPPGLLPPAVMRALQKATAKDPADRWSSAGAFVAALEAAGVVTPDDHLARTDMRAAARRPWRSRVGQIGAAAAVLLATWLAWVVVPRGSLTPSAFPNASERSTDIALPSAIASVPLETRPAPRANPTTPNRQRARSISTESPPTPVAPESVPSLPLPPVNIESSRAPIVQIPSSADLTGATGADRRPPDVASATAPVADVVTPPVQTHKVMPDYPTAARAAQLEGDVALRARVGTDGKISDVDVLRGVHPVLDAAARKAVMQYEYAPARRNGIPEPAIIRITVSFRLR